MKVSIYQFDCKFGIFNVWINDQPEEWEIRVDFLEMSWAVFCQRFWDDFQKFPEQVQSYIRRHMSTLQIESGLPNIYNGAERFIFPGEPFCSVLADDPLKSRMEVKFLDITVEADSLAMMIINVMLDTPFICEVRKDAFVYRDARRKLVEAITSQ